MNESTSFLMRSLQENGNRLELYRYQSQLKVQEAINGTALATLRRADEAALLKAVKTLIVALSDSLNLAHNLNEGQVVEITFLIAERYYYLKLEELVLVFKKAKMGEYGKTYNRLDVQIIFEWIDKYFCSEERALVLEREARQYKQREKQQYSTLTEVGRKLFEKIKDEMPPPTPLRTIRLPSNETFFNEKLRNEAQHIPDDELITLLHYYEQKDYKAGIKILQDEMRERGVTT